MVIFVPGSFKFCVVVDIKVTDKLGGKSKGVWHLGAWHLWVYTKMSIIQSFFELGPPNFAW